MAKPQPELQPVGSILESSKTAAERRLRTIEGQVQSQASHVHHHENESTVLKSVITNFHKKPLQERLNEVINMPKL